MSSILFEFYIEYTKYIGGLKGGPDKLAIESVGFKNCVSAPNGAKGLTFFENCRDRLDEVKAFIWAGDNDSDGKALEAELTRRLGTERFKRVTWPSDCKDANDVLMKHGATALGSVSKKQSPILSKVCSA